MLPLFNKFVNKSVTPLALSEKRKGETPRKSQRKFTRAVGKGISSCGYTWSISTEHFE